MNRPDKRLVMTTLMAAILGLSGCIESGSSGNFLTEDSSDTGDTGDTGGQSFTVSGKLTSSTSLVVDSDVNDILANYASNDSMAEAQSLSNLVTVQGFASAVPTNAQLSGTAAAERFDSTSDTLDYYSVNLLKDQTILLTVSNAVAAEGSYNGDLDLYLLDNSGTLVLFSNTSDEIERITVPSDGEYYIRVQAHSGVSKYVLQLLPSTSAATASFGQQPNFVAGEMLVGYEANQQTAGLSNPITGFSLSPQSYRTDRANRVVIHSTAQQSLPTTEGNHHQKIQTLDAIKAMAKSNGIRYAEPNYIRQPYVQPDDPFFLRQWHYNQINLSQAWDITTGSRSDNVPVVVAVIDTGVFLAHEDLANKLTSDGYDFISDVENANDNDGIDNNPDDAGDGFILSASSWHGTHVAGTIAAETNNATGVAGVSWDARIMPIRALGKFGGSSYDLVQSIRYAAGLSNDSNTVPTQKADIINMSLGSFSSSTAEQEAIEQAIEAGVVIVAAAGNESTSTLSYPASYPGVISVSATDAGDNLADYSNFGSMIDIAAPGGDTRADLSGDGLADAVYSTLVSVSGSTRSNGYEGYQGTSMAAPHVAGVIALMKAINPNLTPTQINALIQQGELTDDLSNDGAATRNDSFGYGRINAFKAVQAAVGTSDGSITIPAILSTSPSVMNMGTSGAASFSISNVGGGNPIISEVTVSQPWGSIVDRASEETGLGFYELRIDRSNLNDGFYTAVVSITGTDGDESISHNVSVYMTVGNVASIGAITRQYLLVLDSNNNTVVETTVELDGSYSLTVPSGEYRVVAGSDTDVDSYICDAGETCGGYPSINQLSEINVTQNVSDIDFPVDIIGASNALSDSTRNGSSKAFQRKVNTRSFDEVNGSQSDSHGKLIRQ